MLIAHAIFLILFVLLFITSYKIYKIDSEIFLKKQEFERKKEWETFNYNLHKEDRLRREKYERIKAIINNLVDKEIPEKNMLLKMREELGSQQAMEDMKLIEEFLTKEQSANK